MEPPYSRVCRTEHVRRERPAPRDRGAVPLDGPPVGAVVGLAPPAIEDRQVQRPVQAGLHPAGPTGLERWPWDVDPDIATRYELRRHPHVVVLEEGHPLSPDQPPLLAEHALQD